MPGITIGRSAERRSRTGDRRRRARPRGRRSLRPRRIPTSAASSTPGGATPGLVVDDEHRQRPPVDRVRRRWSTRSADAAAATPAEEILKVVPVSAPVTSSTWPPLCRRTRRPSRGRGPVPLPRSFVVKKRLEDPLPDVFGNAASPVRDFEDNRLAGCDGIRAMASASSAVARACAGRSARPRHRVARR